MYRMRKLWLPDTVDGRVQGVVITGDGIRSPHPHLAARGRFEIKIEVRRLRSSQERRHQKWEYDPGAHP